MKRLIIALLCLSGAAVAQVTGKIPSTVGGAGCVIIAVGPKVSTIGIQVTGTWSGTLQPEVSIQGQAGTDVQVSPSTSTTPASTITANGVYSAAVAGADSFMLCGNTVGSGTANVYLNFSTAGSSASIGGGGGGGGSSTYSINNQTASYQLLATDAHTEVRMNVAGANNLTVPADSTVLFPTGTIVIVRQVGAGQTTIVAAGGVTITTPSSLLLRVQNSTVQLIKVAANTWDLTGDVQ